MKINYLAPTITPAAPYSIYNIESPIKAVDYYQSLGIECILQQKHMGSRCQIYLFEDDSSYVVSKSGRVIWSKNHTQIDLFQQIEEVKKIFDWSQQKMYLIDAELMPWSTLGKNLINKQFRGYFEAKYLSDQFTTTISPGQRIFECFTQEVTPYFEIFDVLKIVLKDDSEIIYPNEHSGKKFIYGVKVHPDNIDVYIPMYQRSYIEGVVIKPLTVSRDVLPAIKCRNNDFVQMLYGGLGKSSIIEMRQNSLKHKQKRALREHQRAWDMLHIPYSQCPNVVQSNYTPEDEDPRL